MSSDAYWSERTELERKRTDNTISTLMKRMNTLYTGTTQRIEKEIESFYARYADKTGMTISDVKKRLTDPELRRFKTEVREYYDEVNKYKKYKYGLIVYKKELDELSARAYISRLEDLKTQIKYYVMKLGLSELTEMDKALSDLYKDTFDHQYFNVDKSLGFSNGYAGLNTKIIDKALSKTWLGENYSDRIWKNKAKLLSSIETKFMQGVAMGKGVKDIAKEVSSDCNVSYNSALRLVTTESGHIANEATFDSYQEHGVDKYQYVADLSEKTCPICGTLDGQVFKMSEMEEGINYPEMHPNCRCTTIAYYEPDELSDMLQTSRIAKDEEGKWFDVPSSMTYAQWYDKIYGRKESDNAGKKG